MESTIACTGGPSNQGMPWPGAGSTLTNDNERSGATGAALACANIRMVVRVQRPPTLWYSEAQPAVIFVHLAEAKEN